MNSYDFILFCFCSFIFPLYIFYCEFMNFANKIKVVFANVDKPLAVFLLDDLCS